MQLLNGCYHLTTKYKQLLNRANELVHLITMGNEKIHITFNFQKLIGAHEPIHVTVIEVRNHIAQPRQHDKQIFEFSELSVQLSGGFMADGE